MRRDVQIALLCVMPVDYGVEVLTLRCGGVVTERDNLVTIEFQVVGNRWHYPTRFINFVDQSFSATDVFPVTATDGYLHRPVPSGLERRVFSWQRCIDRSACGSTRPAP